MNVACIEIKNLYETTVQVGEAYVSGRDIHSLYNYIEIMLLSMHTTTFYTIQKNTNIYKQTFSSYILQK